MPLSPTEVRILGCLVEKASTTPDAYPLSLNALTNACNQTTNRDPVMDLGEDAVRWAVNNLRQQSLVRGIQPSDSRVMKFQHLLTEKLDLEGPALAVMCVLMLRGPQTVGEIRTRTTRLTEFANLSDVEAVLSELERRELVAEVPRRPGQKETRYTHLLSGPVTAEHADSSAGEPHVETTAGSLPVDRVAQLESTVADLRRELSELQARFEEFRRQFGE